MLLFASLAWGLSPHEVETALSAAAERSSDASTAHALQLAVQLRQQEDASLHRLLESYARVLRYPHDPEEFSYARYAADIEAEIKPNRKHRFLRPTLCGLRNILHTEEQLGAADFVESLGRRVWARCGPRQLVARYATPLPPPTLVGPSAESDPSSP